MKVKTIVTTTFNEKFETVKTIDTTFNRQYIEYKLNKMHEKFNNSTINNKSGHLNLETENGNVSFRFENIAYFETEIIDD